MSRESDALNTIKGYQVCTNYGLDEYKSIGEVLPNSFKIIEEKLKDYDMLLEEYNSMKKEYAQDRDKLKAFEIIKENKINGLRLKWDGEWWTIYAPDCPYPIAYGRKKEEFDLLKEVLTDE